MSFACSATEQARGGGDASSCVAVSPSGWRACLERGVRKAGKRVHITRSSARRAHRAVFRLSCAYQIAEVRAFRGEIDLAFASLARAYELRDHGLSYLKGGSVRSIYTAIHIGNPFSKKMGLAD